MPSLSWPRTFPPVFLVASSESLTPPSSSSGNSYSAIVSLFLSVRVPRFQRRSTDYQNTKRTHIQKSLCCRGILSLDQFILRLFLPHKCTVHGYTNQLHLINKCLSCALYLPGYALKYFKLPDASFQSRLADPVARPPFPGKD